MGATGRAPGSCCDTGTNPAIPATGSLAGATTADAGSGGTALPHAGQNFESRFIAAPQRVQDIVSEPAAYQRCAGTSNRFRSARGPDGARVEGVPLAVKQQRPFQHGLEL